jgi:hypothetical protein
MSAFYPHSSPAPSMVPLNGFAAGVSRTSGTSASDPDPTLVTEGEHHYVQVTDHSEYGILLRNTRGVRSRAEIRIDGESVGTWILSAHQTVTIERPIKEKRAFTFVADTSAAAKSAGVVAGASQNGLVSVTFTPEKEQLFHSRGGASATRFRKESHGGDFSEASRDSSRRITNEKSMLCCQESCADDDGAALADLVEAGSASMNSASAKPAAAGSAARESLSKCKSGATVLGQTNNQAYHTVSDITDEDKENVTTIILRLIVAPPRPEFLGLHTLNKPISTSIPPPLA